jgi:hypothetical protein
VLDLDLDLVLGPGVDRFVRWAADRDTPVPGRPAAVLLGMLTLRGARMRGGLPEPTAGLIRQVLCEDLPNLAAGSPEDQAAYPRVLTLLVDQRRADGLLNAKRQGKLHAAVRDALAEYQWAMARTDLLTWPRFYGRLLRADGVDPADAQAVRRWLGEYRQRPMASRRAALTSARTSAFGGADDGPPGLGVKAQAELMVLRTDVAELAVQNLILAGIRNEDVVRAASARYERDDYDSGEDGDDEDDGTEDVETEIEKVVADAGDVLVDLGTAAGLSGALRGEFRDLAPRRGDRGVHGLMERLGDLCDEEHGDYPALPPTVEVPVDEVAAAVRSAPLLSAAADLAAWVDGQGGVPIDAGVPAAGGWPAARELGLAGPARAEVARLAVATGLLRSAGGRAVAGDGLQVWRDGTPDEVIGLGLDAFGGVLEGLSRLAAEPGLGGDAADSLLYLVEDVPFTLIRMFEDATAPVSLARMAAEIETWEIPPRVVEGEDPATPAAVPPAAVGVLAAQLRPPHPIRSKDDDRQEPPADADAQADAGHPGAEVDLDYRLPSDAELERLLGVTDLDDGDRAELLDTAFRQALIFDRLAALGLLRRDGDRAWFTRPGRAILRLAFLLAGGDAPTVEDLAAVDATQLLCWMRRWSGRAQGDGLVAWLDAHGGDDAAWREVLAASATEPGRGVFYMLGVRPGAGSGNHRLRPRPPALPTPLPDPAAETALTTALAALVPDPVIGAYAAEALRLRGRPAADPPRPAQAVLLCDRIHRVMRAELSRSFFRTDDDEPGRSGQAGESPEPGEPDREPRPAYADAACAEFDRAAADWPGGARELIRHLATAASAGSGDVLRTLGGHHPDPAIARAGRAALHTSPASTSRHRTRPAGDGTKSAARNRAKRRRR